MDKIELKFVFESGKAEDIETLHRVLNALQPDVVACAASKEELTKVTIIDQQTNKAVTLTPTPAVAEKWNSEGLDEHGYPKNLAPPLSKEQIAANKAKVEEMAAKKAEAAQKTESSLTVEDIRLLVTQKVDNHRPTIKAKLTELGASSVTALASENYQVFYNFLKALS